MRDVVDSGDNNLDKKPTTKPKVVSSSLSVSLADGAISGILPTQPGKAGSHLPEYNLTHESLLTQQYRSHEWCRHVFPPTTLDSLELLSHYRMANDL